MPQWGLLVMLDLLKGWPVVQVSCHVPAVMSFRAKRGSFSIITACTRRPNIKIMCLSRGRKHAGTMRKRFPWEGERSQCLMREFWSIVRPCQNSSGVDLLKQLMWQSENLVIIEQRAWNARRPCSGEFFLFSLCHWNT